MGLAFAAAVWAVSIENAGAEAAVVGPVAITVPAGFQSAGSQHRDAMRVTAWTMTTPGRNTKALLQVSVYDFKSQLKGASPQDLAAGAEKFLKDYLGGVQRRRTNYASSPITHLTLAGLPAAKATWRGQANGMSMVGVMYCAILRNRYVVSFHTQDLGNEPTAAMREAMNSIESVQLTARP